MEMVALDGSRQRLDVVVVRLLVFGDFCCESYMGPFTEVPCFEETKAVWAGAIVLQPYQVVLAPNQISFAILLT